MIANHSLPSPSPVTFAASTTQIDLLEKIPIKSYPYTSTKADRKAKKMKRKNKQLARKRVK